MKFSRESSLGISLMFTLLSLLFNTKFSSARYFKNQLQFNWIIFNILGQKPRKPNTKFEKENRQNFSCLFSTKPTCLQNNFHGRLLAIRVFSADGHYLNNRVFLSRTYRLIVAPRKCDVLKTNICPRSEASRANMLVLRTSNFQRQISDRQFRDINTPLSLLFTT